MSFGTALVGAAVTDAFGFHALQLGLPASAAPQQIRDTLAFMFESRFILRPTAHAMNAPQLQRDYIECWQDLKKKFRADRS